MIPQPELTKNEIERSSAIAIYMGAVFIKGWKSDIYPFPKDTFEFNVDNKPTPWASTHWTPEQLQYRYSWSWTMPVVIKVIGQKGALLLSVGLPDPDEPELKAVATIYTSIQMVVPICHAHGESELHALFLAVSDYAQMQNKLKIQL